MCIAGSDTAMLSNGAADAALVTEDELYVADDADPAFTFRLQSHEQWGVFNERFGGHVVRDSEAYSEALTRGDLLGLTQGNNDIIALALVWAGCSTNDFLNSVFEGWNSAGVPGN